MDSIQKNEYNRQSAELEEWKQLCEKPQHELIAEIFTLRNKLEKIVKEDLF